MLKLPLIYFAIILISFSACRNRANESIVNLEVEFDGGKREFYKKYNLWTEINDTILIKEIMMAIDTSEAIIVCPSTRPVMWQIDVFANYVSGEDAHLFTVNSNTYNKLSLQKGGRCFDNHSLIEKMIDIAMVEKVGKFQGPMSQADYEKLRMEK